MNLSNLVKLQGKEGRKKRLGRGIGSGKGGHTVGRGNKGQKARKGNKKPWLGFEGGQVPLYKRLPQTGGFKGRTKPVSASLNIFNGFKDGEQVTPTILRKKKLIRYLPSSGVKVLSSGELRKKISFKGFTYSAAAIKKIEKSGAKVLQ